MFRVRDIFSGFGVSDSKYRVYGVCLKVKDQRSGFIGEVEGNGIWF